MIVMIRQQFTVPMDDGSEVVTPVQTTTVQSVDDAIQVFYDTYGYTPLGSSLYATISVNGRFLRSIQIGGLNGFKSVG